MSNREDREYYVRMWEQSGIGGGCFPAFLIIIAVVVLCCLLTGCKTVRSAEKEQTRDSLRVEVRYTETVIRDTVEVEIPAQTAERTTADSVSRLENDYATSEARINPDGSLYHDLRTKPQKKPVEVPKVIQEKDSIIYRDRDQYITVTDTVEVKKPLTWWEKTQIYGLWLFLSLWIIRHSKKIFSTIVRRFREK